MPNCDHITSENKQKFYNLFGTLKVSSLKVLIETNKMLINRYDKEWVILFEEMKSNLEFRESIRQDSNDQYKMFMLAKKYNKYIEEFVTADPVKKIDTLLSRYSPIDVIVETRRDRDLLDECMNTVIEVADYEYLFSCYRKPM